MKGDNDRLSPVYGTELTGGGLGMLIDSSTLRTWWPA
jgi:hypothetical protein